MRSFSFNKLPPRNNNTWTVQAQRRAASSVAHHSTGRRLRAIVIALGAKSNDKQKHQSPVRHLTDLATLANNSKQSFSRYSVGWHAAALATLSRFDGSIKRSDAQALALQLAHSAQRALLRRGSDHDAELALLVAALARVQERLAPAVRPVTQAAVRQLEQHCIASLAGAVGRDASSLLSTVASAFAAARRAEVEVSLDAIGAVVAAAGSVILSPHASAAEDTAAAICALARLEHRDPVYLDAAAAALVQPSSLPERPAFATLLPPVAVAVMHSLAQLAWPSAPLLHALLDSCCASWLSQLDPRGASMMAWAAVMHAVLLEEQGGSTAGLWPKCVQVYWRCVCSVAQNDALDTSAAAQLHQARVLLAHEGCSDAAVLLEQFCSPGGLDKNRTGVLEQQPGDAAAVADVLQHCARAWERQHSRKVVSAVQRAVADFVSTQLGVPARLEAPADRTGAFVAGITVDIAVEAADAARLSDVCGGRGCDDSTPLAIEVDGPSHYAANDSCAPLGATVAREWLLRRLGWRVAVVRQWPCGDDDDGGARQAAVLAECVSKAH